MSEQPICGKCGLPIHKAETGLRYFGHYIAHNENRCLELLRYNSEALERQLADVRESILQSARANELLLEAMNSVISELESRLQSADVEAATLCQKGQNRHGVDCGYFSQKLALVLRDLRYYTREELSLELERLSKTALPASDGGGE